MQLAILYNYFTSIRTAVAQSGTNLIIISVGRDETN